MKDIQLTILDTNKVTDISGFLLRTDGKIRLIPYEEYNGFSWEDFRYFCHLYARYGIPTIELIDFLKKIIGNRVAIEIGAGSGDLGYHLGIHMTDSKLQEDPVIKETFEMNGQPTIKYPDDVEKIEALDAVIKYKPQVVVASWVTTFSPFLTNYSSSPYGIKEKEILDLIDTYILVGHLNIHGDKPIMNMLHREINEPFILSRSSYRTKNRIFIWDK